MNPAVSIGMPVYDGENYLRQAVDSILGQTFGDFELIISDNASTDATHDICEDYSRRDARIRVYRNETNLGAAANYNRTVALATAPLFKWAAHDDVLAPTFLERCIGVLEQDREVVLCHTQSRFIDESGMPQEDYGVHLRTDSVVPHIRFHDLIWVRHWCLQVFGVMRRDALDHTDLHGDYASADRVLLVQMAFQGRFHEVPQRLFFSRRHSQQASRLVYDLHKYDRWFGPRRGASWPATRLVLEHLSAVRQAELSSAERARCYWSGMLRLTRFLKIWSRDLTVPIRTALGHQNSTRSLP